LTLRLIIFDLDDTLWDSPPVLLSAEAALQRWLDQYAPALGGDAGPRIRANRQWLLEQDPTLKIRISALRQQALQRSLQQAGYAAAQAVELAAGAFAHFLAARQQVELFPEVRPTLERLAGQFTLGVLTNGNADVQRIGIAGYFRFAFSAEQLGVSKPDPRAFHAVLQQAGVAAGQAVHIGDHPRDDIHGAQTAGLRAVWVNPQGKPWEGERAPDAQIASLAELPALLARWQHGS
jgi:putative hydrolase of the HAD superfamily